MKFSALFSAFAAALVAREATAQPMAQGLDCIGQECIIIHVTFCGDPHLKTMDGEWFNVDGECSGAMLMENDDYDGEGHKLMIMADVKQKKGVPVVGGATVKFGDDTLEVKDDGTFMMNGGEQDLSAASVTGMTMAGSHQVIVEEKSLEAPKDGRALTYGLLYLVIYIYCGFGVIITITTKYGVLCITIIGAYFRLKIIVGIFGFHGGHRELEGAANKALRDSPRHLMPDVPSGCAIEPTGEARRRNRKLAALTNYEQACAHVDESERKLCALGSMLNDDSNTEETKGHLRL